MLDLALSPDICYRVERFGNEATPVIIVDNVLNNHEDLIEFSCSKAVFDSDSTTSYPGIKAELPDQLFDVLNPFVAPLLYRLYRVPAFLRPICVDRFFSLLTLAPESLKVLQRAPHFDSNNPLFFASLLYLKDAEFGGTGFFRHKPTGFERISSERCGQYIRGAQIHMHKYGVPKMQYMTGSDDHYELIGEVEHKANRLIIYPGNLLHSGLVDPARDVDPKPETGRLTANVFVEFN